jgi:hypothetical protein
MAWAGSKLETVIASALLNLVTKRAASDAGIAVFRHPGLISAQIPRSAWVRHRPAAAAPTR